MSEAEWLALTEPPGLCRDFEALRTDLDRALQFWKGEPRKLQCSPRLLPPGVGRPDRRAGTTGGGGGGAIRGRPREPSGDGASASGTPPAATKTADSRTTTPTPSKRHSTHWTASPSTGRNYRTATPRLTSRRTGRRTSPIGTCAANGARTPPPGRSTTPTFAKSTPHARTSAGSSAAFSETLLRQPFPSGDPRAVLVGVE